MSQTDTDIQLQVWKDLAISKQILMGAATDALGLDAECSTDELREALNKAIQRAKDTDINIIKTREETDQKVAEMVKQVDLSNQARTKAEEQIVVALEAQKIAERQLASGRAENAETLKKARAEINDKQAKLKAISKALADTPENVVKKLKTLKKQKLDESKLRTQAESKLQKSRKEITRLEASLESQKSLLADCTPLIEQLKELNSIGKKQNKTIKSLSDDKQLLARIPKLDKELLEKLESALSGDES